MEKKLYWRNVVNGPFFTNLEPGMAGTSIWAHHNEYKNGTTFAYHCVKELYQAVDPHSHAFHETFVFLGSDPENIDDLHGGEVHITLGEEREEYVLTSAGVVEMPAGLLHCPLIIMPREKPIVFIEISQTGGYTETFDENAPNFLLNPPEPPKSFDY